MIKFLLYKKTVYGSFRQEFQWLNVKHKSFRHIQAYSKPCVTLIYLKLWYVCNPDIFRTKSIFRIPAYSQLWYIQNLLYSERWHIQNLRHIQNSVYIYDEALIIFTAIIVFTNYNSFCKACHVEISILRQILQRWLCYVKNYGA